LGAKTNHSLRIEHLLARECASHRLSRGRQHLKGDLLWFRLACDVLRAGYSGVLWCTSYPHRPLCARNRTFSHPRGRWNQRLVEGFITYEHGRPFLHSGIFCRIEGAFLASGQHWRGGGFKYRTSNVRDLIDSGFWSLSN